MDEGQDRGNGGNKWGRKERPNRSGEAAQTERARHSERVHVPPSDYASEQAVLGAVLIDATAFSKVVEFVRRESFYWDKHSTIFEAMNRLFRDNEPTDIVTVATALREDDKLESVGGEYYLSELSDSVPFPRNVDYYAQIVQEKFVLREIAAISEDFGSRVYDPSADPADVLDWSIGELFLLQRHSERSGYRHIEPINVETLEDLDRISKREGKLTGVTSGYDDLDQKTGGWQETDLIILAARPSMGKTALALCFAYNAAKEDKTPVGIISLEMGAKQIAMRLLSLEANVPLYKIRTASFTADENQRIARAASSISNLPIYIDDTPTQSITEVRARARRLQMQYDCGMIMIDYLQLMQPPARAESQQQAMAQISRQLKGLAKELGVPVIALSQLSRQVEQRGGSKRPILSDLRDSGAIEQDADVVMFVYREAYYKRQEQGALADGEPVDNTSEIIIGKQRNGPTGTVKLLFQPEFVRFRPLSSDYAMPPEQAGAPMGASPDFGPGGVDDFSGDEPDF